MAHRRSAPEKEQPASADLPPAAKKSGGSAPGTVTWSVGHRPLTDWNTWNALMRFLLPAIALVFVAACVLETISGGLAALTALLSGTFPSTLLLLVLILSVLYALVLFLQGPDVLNYRVDGKGFHISCLLPRPTPLRLLARARSADLKSGEDGLVPISHLDIAWNEVSRVQLWPGKTTLLIYRRSAFVAAALHCTPFAFPAVTDQITKRLGKKKHVRLSAALKPPPAPPKTRAKSTTSGKSKAASKKPAPSLSDSFLADIRRMNAEDEARSRREDEHPSVR